MSIFLELYGEDLDRELGTADRTQRFTTARRKRAVNQGQREFVRQTEAVVAEARWPVADEDSVFNLQTAIPAGEFMRFSTRQPYIEIDNGTTITTISGKSFLRKDIETLDREQEGWRGVTKGRPQNWYFKDDDDEEFIGIYPPANVRAGETWTLVVPYVKNPTEMVSDNAIPWENRRTLAPFHQALVHYAASQLEKLRRNYTVSAAQLDAFNGYVNEFLGNKRQAGGEMVEFGHNYFAAAMRQGADPGVDPLLDD